MSVRATLTGAFAAGAIIIVGWQVGVASHAHAALAATATGSSGTTGSGTSGSSSSAKASSSSGSGSTSSTKKTSASATPTPTSTASAPSGSASTAKTYTGDVEQTRYGPVQVAITVKNGKITDVTALQLTNQDGRSVQISNQAAPILQQEVLVAQSAQVNYVSGATYTSDGYLRSVQSALDQAGL